MCLVLGAYLIQLGPPSEPQKPVVSKVTSTSVKLKWAAPDMDGGVAILSYQVEMFQEGIDLWQPIVQQPRSFFVVKTLEPLTTYKFRVSAVNEYGFGAPSEPSDSVLTKSIRGLLGSSGSNKTAAAAAASTTSSSEEVKGQF